jgi:uncharacterized membrane protein (DUF2068 family)
MDANTPKPSAKNRAPTLYFIALCKLAKGVALLLIAASIFFMAQQDLQGDFDKFIEWVRLDPEHSFFRNISDYLAHITPGNIRATALAFFLYGCFLLVGGTGLALRAKWAIWLTIGESAFFIPIEIFELTGRHPRADSSDEASQASQHLFTDPRVGFAIVLVLNILIVWYLLKNRERLFRHHQ